MHGLGRSLVLFACIAIFLGPASAEKRIALVIGNGAYTSMQPLKNPTNDAHDIAAALEDLGFAVTIRSDLSREEMLSATTEFANDFASADVAIFYYGGHGIQVDLRNYLIPVDAALESPQDVAPQTVDLRAIIDQLEIGQEFRIVFLDACRNNPVPNLKLPAGLAAPDLPRENFLIAYSASRGEVAYDGGGRNSPYASAVLQHLQEKGRDITALLAAARSDVKLSTGQNSSRRNGRHSPSRSTWHQASATSFHRKPCSSSLPRTARIPIFSSFISRYPDGAHVDSARSLVELPTAAGGNAQGARADLRQVEDLLWSLAHQQRIGPLVQLYLARYPDGVHAQEARELLPSLETGGDVPPDLLCLQLATHPNDSTALNRGVPASVLRESRDRAVAACRAAVTAFPDNPHFVRYAARHGGGPFGRRDPPPRPSSSIRMAPTAATPGQWSASAFCRRATVSRRTWPARDRAL